MSKEKLWIIRAEWMQHFWHLFNYINKLRFSLYSVLSLPCFDTLPFHGKIVPQFLTPLKTSTFSAKIQTLNSNGASRQSKSTFFYFAKGGRKWSISALEYVIGKVSKNTANTVRYVHRKKKAQDLEISMKLIRCQKLRPYFSVKWKCVKIW